MSNTDERTDSKNESDAREKGRLRMVTHKVVIDADDADHAAWIAEALRNDGYRVQRERHEWVDRNGSITIDRKRVNDA